MIKRVKLGILCCTLCGREIGKGEEYWVCNGCTACGECLEELARQELAACREVRGYETDFWGEAMER